MVFLTGIFFSGSADAQSGSVVTGSLAERITSLSVPYAYVSLYRIADSSLARMVVSDTTGRFELPNIGPGDYQLRINVLGYNPVKKEISISGGKACETGVIFLEEYSVNPGEAVVAADKIKAKSEPDRTTYFITEKIAATSISGTDVLRSIPGVQIDLMHNISLEGSSNIMFLVNGMERDRNYISQIDPAQIEKIEITTIPPSKYDSGITGVISIILKKERKAGISGQVHAEVPVFSSVMYLQPAFSFNYGRNKFNLFTSYSGELIYANLDESVDRTVYTGGNKSEYSSDKLVRQKYWSHRLDYGFDYFINKKNQLNFYAFYNPYSRELDGNASMHQTGEANYEWEARKEDSDINRSNFHSLYFRHNFNERGDNLTFDLSNFNLNAETTVAYYPVTGAGAEPLINNVKPNQNSSSLKIDLNVSPFKRLSFNAGLKVKLTTMKDAASAEFRYNEHIYAAYGGLSYRKGNLDLGMGIRVENSLSESGSSLSNKNLSALPYASISYRPCSAQNLQLSFSQSLTRPNINQLNPYAIVDDPFTVQQGNPELYPEIRSMISLEHSIRFRNNYLSTRLFYNRVSDAIGNYSFINDTSAFETRVYNLGSVNQYGIQLSGAVQPWKIFTFNPWVRVYGNDTRGNEKAQKAGIADRKQLVLESGLSAILTFRHDLALSFSLQYSSPENNIQDNHFSDVFYLLSIDKTFRQKFKAGIATGLPFTRNFTYQGSETRGIDFHNIYKGQIIMPGYPMVWFRFSYEFNSGKKRDKIERTREEADVTPKKGF